MKDSGVILPPLLLLFFVKSGDECVESLSKLPRPCPGDFLVFGNFYIPNQFSVGQGLRLK
jgi:hypothetical protein